MTIVTNTANRKVLADQLSRLIGEPYRYLGTPSYAYQVGPYTINRDGSLTGADFGPIRAFLIENGYIHEAVEDEETVPETARETDEEPADRTVYVSIPIGELSPIGLCCLLKTLYARQALIAAMTKSDAIRIDEELVTRLNDEKPESLESVQNILADEVRIGMVTGAGIEEGKLQLGFPYDDSKPTEWQAYAELLTTLVKRAWHTHHVNAKKLDPSKDEMKYFCRNWLMQLGLGGAEHKETRSILLGHLHGFAAFRTADKMEAHKARQAALRRAAREEKDREATDNE